jgi:hypothetical protein
MNTVAETDGKLHWLYGLINFVVAFFIVCGLWYVLMHPNGILKLYTPMWGFSLVVVFLVSVVLITKTAEYYPLSPERPEGASRVARGVSLTVIALLLTLFIVFGIFRGFIGKFGVAYFSPASIVASGGTGAEPLNAREQASTALIYFASAYLYLALWWSLGFGRWPWVSTSRGVAAFSRLTTTVLLTVVVFAVLFHPHVCQLFYPVQDKAGVSPWWASFTGTGSAFVSLGLLLCALAWIVISDLLWEGRPWNLLDRNGEGTFAKGAAVFIGTMVLGVITCYVLLKIMNVYWMEPFEGGQYTDAPYFRYLHAGEISGFAILSAFLWKTYFFNAPRVRSMWLRAAVRTVVAFVGAFACYWFYYSPASTLLLGKVPGIAQPDDTPLVWTILFLALVMVQAEFFEGWPLGKPEKRR